MPTLQSVIRYLKKQNQHSLAQELKVVAEEVSLDNFPKIFESGILSFKRKDNQKMIRVDDGVSLLYKATDAETKDIIDYIEVTQLPKKLAEVTIYFNLSKFGNLVQTIKSLTSYKIGNLIFKQIEDSIFKDFSKEVSTKLKLKRG